VTLEGWIFMIGLRVFDVGALIVWLVWFFRLREDDDDSDDFRGGGGNAPEPEEPKGPAGGLDIPLADSRPWPTRRRDHGGDRRHGPLSPRRGVPQPVPARAPVKRR
jgi:hypothetical protein